MSFFDRRFYTFFNWPLFLTLCCLSAIGLAFVFSTTYTMHTPFSLFFKKQLFGVISGLVLYLLLSHSNHHTLLHWSYPFYYMVIGMLIFTLLKGHIGMGGQRWINFGLFKLQPSELTKICFPAFVAHYCLTRADIKPYSYRDYLYLGTYLALSLILILKQPDLGTGLIVLFSALILFWLLSLPQRLFFYSLLVVLLGAPLLWTSLKPYQQKRVTTFLGYGDAQHERYQIEQSKIAIGSGGLTGKGFLQGTQNRLQFLPERRTDFIAAIIAEEWGLIGIVGVLILYGIVFLQLFVLIMQLETQATQLLAVGLATPIILSVLINIGMVTGLVPVVGIPLPFLSYGISNLWVSYASLGWLQGMVIHQSHTH